MTIAWLWESLAHNALHRIPPSLLLNLQTSLGTNRKAGPLKHSHKTRTVHPKGCRRSMFLPVRRLYENGDESIGLFLDLVKTSFPWNTAEESEPRSWEKEKREASNFTIQFIVTFICHCVRRHCHRLRLQSAGRRSMAGPLKWTLQIDSMPVTWRRSTSNYKRDRWLEASAWKHY